MAYYISRIIKTKRFKNIKTILFDIGSGEIVKTSALVMKNPSYPDRYIVIFPDGSYDFSVRKRGQIYYGKD